MQIDTSWFQIDPWLIVVIVLCIIAFLAIAVNWGIRAHRRKVSAGMEDLVGRTAEVKEVLKPRGMVLVQGERWKAELDKGQAKLGEEVIITKVDGLKLWVTKKS